MYYSNFILVGKGICAYLITAGSKRALIGKGHISEVLKADRRFFRREGQCQEKIESNSKCRGQEARNSMSCLLLPQNNTTHTAQHDTEWVGWEEGWDRGTKMARLGMAVTFCLKFCITSDTPYLANLGVASLFGSITLMEKLSTNQAVLPN